MAEFKSVGKRELRVDAFDKVTGRAQYTDDLVGTAAYSAKIVHATIAHGYVKKIHTEEAEKIPGVVKIVTCFEVPENYFPTAGHPWTLDPAHQDVADRLVLTKHVRYYGDDIAAVIAENDFAAEKAVRAVKVEYEELPFVLDQLDAIKDGAPQLHDRFPNNILSHTTLQGGNLEEAIKEPGLHCIDKWYRTPTVQHAHIENHVCCARIEKGKVIVTSSTQIPFMIRRIVGQALGIPWGQVEIIKPYVGGGFGNKQDALYEPLCAFLTTTVGGRPVKLEASREETFWNNRVRHNLYFHFTTWYRTDGTFVARKYEAYSRQGAYASHGHAIAAKEAGAFLQLYTSPSYQSDAYTVFTNTTPAGAMRGYGMPQISFAVEAHVDDIAHELGMSPFEIRKKNLMRVGFKDNFSGNVNRWPSHIQCLEKGMAFMDWDRKWNLYNKKQTGPIRRGIGMGVFWYNTSVYPIALEMSSCRMILNQDGSIQIQLAETEIGQGADTVYAQMAADAVGIPFEQVHTISTQDTDISPYGFGVYASRGTFMAGKSIWETGRLLRDKILAFAEKLTEYSRDMMDIDEGIIVNNDTRDPIMPLSELAMHAYYDKGRAVHITAECSHEGRSNAFSFGCSIAEVEVDIPMCKYRVVNIINVHDCGRLINPSLAEAQVHGGISMSIGFGSNEELLYNERTGQPVNGNFLDYKISTIMDHPRLNAQFVENYEPTQPYGTKSLGEPPTLSGAPAIRNALIQATGIEFDDLPVNSHRLFDAFTKAGIFEEVKDYV